MLKNPKLQVTPIGCYECEKTPIIVRGTKCSQNYRVAANDDKILITTMDIGCGKLLLQNTNIKINQVNPINSSSNVNSVKRLKKAKNDYEKIVLNYNTEGFSFDQWLNIEFKVVSDKEGVFYVGY